MGIEYIVINQDKKELLDFAPFGFGTKLGAMTSEPLASFITWLVVNRDGIGEGSHQMLGRWAGDRLEMIGDSSDRMMARQEQARGEFKDITAETIEDYARNNPCECIDLLYPMGLIDKDGKVTFPSQNRETAVTYWREQQEKEAGEAQRFIDGWVELEAALRTGSEEQVRALRCPVSGGPLKIDYHETESGPPYLLVRGITSDLRQIIANVTSKPPWMEHFGSSFVTG